MPKNLFPSATQVETTSGCTVSEKGALRNCLKPFSANNFLPSLNGMGSTKGDRTLTLCDAFGIAPHPQLTRSF
ncbi:MAG: hypothetical protein ACYT04_46460 [Nostoc sp.]